MQICKSILAREIFREFPDVKKVLWGGQFWSDGGHIDTVGDGYDVKSMKEYIMKQGVTEDQLTLYKFVSP